MFSEIQGHMHILHEIPKTMIKLKKFRQVSDFISCLDPKQRVDMIETIISYHNIAIRVFSLE
jgi:hypothetical protein